MEKLFFEKVSEHCNYVDPESVRKIYIGLGKYIVRCLKQEGEANLPNIGKFTLAQYKERMGKNVNTGEMEVFPEVMVVKFKPHRQMKAYFNPKLR